MLLLLLLSMSSTPHLNGLEHWGLVIVGAVDSHTVSSFGSCSRSRGSLGIAVQLEELAHVELGLLEHLHLPDEHIVKREDGVAALLNILADRLRDQLANDVLKVAGGNLALNDFDHLATDAANLGVLGVASLLHLAVRLLGEADAEQTKNEAVGGTYVNLGLDQSLPFLDHGSELVGGQVHAVEVCKAVTALDLLANELELPESILVVVQVSLGNLVHTTLEAIRGNFGSLRTIHKGFSNIADLEHGRCLDIVPVLASERVDNLLFEAFFASF